MWAGAITAIAVFGAYLVARSLSQPIEQLAEEAAAVADGRIESASIATPYSEIEQTAAALQAAYAELDRKVVERTVALAEEARERKEAEERALEASRKKSDYLASVSHELRTPLTSIIGFAELLDNSGATISDEERSEYRRIIRESGDHVLALVDELLDLARIESGESRLEETEVRLASLLSDVVRLFIPQARARGVMLEARDHDVTMRADERRIRQVVLNLVANAIKYTPSGGVVRVSVTTDQRRVSIEVADDGVGMTPEEIETARRRFGRVEDTADLSAGTGLGLALSEQMMNAHGGGLDIASEKGAGTTVIAWMPADRILGQGLA
jgi:signal transduction histidine kinase